MVVNILLSKTSMKYKITFNVTLNQWGMHELGTVFKMISSIEAGGERA